MTVIRDTSLKDAGYKYGGYSYKHGGHVLIDIETGCKELWVANKGHASYGITWRNTDLEFARGLEDGKYS